MVKNVVLTGGIWSTPEMLTGTASAIEDMGFSVKPFGFAEAMGKKSTEHQRASLGNIAVTLSAGMIPTVNTRPVELLAHGPPVPGSVFALMWRAQIITLDHILGARPGSPTAKANRKFLKDCGVVIANPKSFYDNAKHLPTIANFNAFEEAAKLKHSGVTTGILHGEDDKFFQPKEADVELARAAGAETAILPNSMHNDFIIEPDKVATWLMTFAEGHRP